MGEYREYRNITVCTANRNAVDALTLMWESFVKHHGTMRWVVCDDASTDGAKEYANSNASFIIHNPEHKQAGRSIDSACRAVSTKYTLLVDGDVEFLGPVLGALESRLEDDALAVGCIFQAGKVNMFGHELLGQLKIDHSCALFHTMMLQRILDFFSFEAYVSLIRGEYYDGGAMICRAANLMGWKLVRYQDLRRNVLHYGGLSALFVPHEPESTKAIYRKRYDVVKERLRLLREGKQSLDGLTWTDNGWSCGA